MNASAQLLLFIDWMCGMLMSHTATGEWQSINLWIGSLRIGSLVQGVFIVIAFYYTFTSFCAYLHYPLSNSIILSFVPKWYFIGYGKGILDSRTSVTWQHTIWNCWNQETGMQFGWHHYKEKPQKQLMILRFADNTTLMAETEVDLKCRFGQFVLRFGMGTLLTTLTTFLVQN